MPKLSMGFPTHYEGSETEDRWNPDANEQSFLSASRKPQVDGQQEGSSRCNDKPSFCKMSFLHLYLLDLESLYFRDQLVSVN